MDVTPFNPTISRYHEQWSENSKKGDIKSNCKLLADIVCNKDLSETDIIDFAKSHKIKPDGHISKQKNVQDAFNKRFNISQNELYILGEAKSDWRNNASRSDFKSNKMLLENLINNVNISPAAIKKFLSDCAVKSNGAVITSCTKILELKEPNFGTNYSKYLADAQKITAAQPKKPIIATKLPTQTTPLASAATPLTPVQGSVISPKLKSAQVFFFTGPFEGEHTGDADYTNKVVDLLKKESIKATYIKGSTTVNGSELYNPKDITYTSENQDRFIQDDIHRKRAVKNVTDLILSSPGEPKIFHLQLRPPETGCMFLSDDLEYLQKNGVKVVITCHEWKLNDHRMHYQEESLNYFKHADEVIFLNKDDADGAVNLAKKRMAKFPTEFRVSAVPITVSVENPPTVDAVINREKNILVFGLMRENKGFDQGIGLARKLKENNPDGLKVILAGKPASLNYLLFLASCAFDLNDDEMQMVKDAWNKDPLKFTELKKLLLKFENENRPSGLPIEFHLNLDEGEMEKLISKCKYAYKPDNKGFANNSSAIINLMANGCITFAKWGMATDKKFLSGGEHANALVLTDEQRPSLGDFSPTPAEVLAEINRRESDPLQKLNRETAEKALKVTHDPNIGVFCNETVFKQTAATYENVIK